MDDITVLTNYIKPELLILIPVLYLIGMMLKNTTLVQDKFIPVCLGVCGIVLSLLYVFSGDVVGNIANIIFASVTQGILAAGTAVYANELLKQSKRDVD